MFWILWDALFLLGGPLFTFGTGPGSSTIVKANISIDSNSPAAPNSSSSNSLMAAGKDALTTDIPTYKGSLVSSEPRWTHQTIIDATVSVNVTSAEETYNSTSSSRMSSTKRPAAANNHPVKKFVAAAVRSHFDDCPDSHQHFCFHGTCRFLILEETAACVCHPGFVGLRCEHADLLAVVATNHRQQAVATVLVLCVIGCVLIMVLCSFLHCWWRQDCRRRSRAHLYVTEKNAASCYPPESVV
ncbi:protransforming growth factor alpha [Austrofundulus limnaeus]|uniref:Protransforming growth factor alpha n=1 Tax=Austrofundulus limnaeus TaxID=52670 RepID=A0A2I4B1Y4_AUSLI|nr:PREDICTED: protransforming growth factor alpha [Austrofundulus limnaeus]